MWIRTTKDALEGGAFKDGEMDKPVSFSQNGTAQVSDAVGDHLVSAYPEAFEEHNATDDEEEDSE